MSISRIDSRRDRGRDFQSSRLEAELIPGKFKSLESENRSLPPPHGRRPRLPEASSRPRGSELLDQGPVRNPIREDRSQPNY